MSKEVCGYCGKANGWHAFGCPAFDLAYKVGVGTGFLRECYESYKNNGTPKMENVLLIAKLPEVE